MADLRDELQSTRVITDDNLVERGGRMAMRDFATVHMGTKERQKFICGVDNFVQCIPELCETVKGS